MDEAAIIEFIAGALPGVERVEASGNSFFFYGGERMMPLATLVTNDDYDSASNLKRPGVFRLNIGVSKETYRSLFGPQPLAPRDGRVVATDNEFAALDELMPHPIYAPQSWVCVLSPSEATFQERIRPLLEEAYREAMRKQAKRS